MEGLDDFLRVPDSTLTVAHLDHVVAGFAAVIRGGLCNESLQNVVAIHARLLGINLTVVPLFLVVCVGPIVVEKREEGGL